MAKTNVIGSIVGLVSLLAVAAFLVLGFTLDDGKLLHEMRYITTILWLLLPFYWMSFSKSFLFVSERLLITFTITF
jgi:hypothetical protein